MTWGRGRGWGGGNIGWPDWSLIWEMWLDNLNSELSRAFTARAFKFGGPVRLRVGYCLGGGQVSVSFYYCVIKSGPMGSFSGGTIDGPRGAVTTLGDWRWLRSGA